MEHFNWKFVFGAVMVLIYLIMAGMLLFNEAFKRVMQDTYRYLFAALFGLYGIFRGYRLWKNKA